MSEPTPAAARQRLAEAIEGERGDWSWVEVDPRDIAGALADALDDRARRIVERAANMGGCSQTSHERLAIDAAKVDAALSQPEVSATPGLRAAAQAVVKHAEPDEDFEGSYVEYLVNADAIDALRAALAESPVNPHRWTDAPDNEEVWYCEACHLTECGHCPHESSCPGLAPREKAER